MGFHKKFHKSKLDEITVFFVLSCYKKKLNIRKSLGKAEKKQIKKEKVTRLLFTG